MTTRSTMAQRATGDQLIRVEGLFKSFPLRRPWTAALRHPLRRARIEVLRGVSLEVRRGEFFGLLGPNGAGKTTLFKILATLVLPEAGAVEVAGVDALRRPDAVRDLLTPVIADERSLNWRLTGVENLLLYAALYGVPDAERRSTARRLLETVGLTEAEDRMVGTYSSGMKQRLLIARALLSRPSVLLLDEPTRSLDPVSARDFRRFLREEVAGRQGCTVMLATHDADEALELCDRLAVLHRGRLVAQGTARELAGIAGEHRYRIVLPQDQAPMALELLGQLGHTTFAPAVTISTKGWACLEGDLPGGVTASAELLSRLGTAELSVAEFARIPLPLADMIERLVERGEQP
jgi:ABC-2 type transport system ATP-binding protein